MQSFSAASAASSDARRRSAGIRFRVLADGVERQVVVGGRARARGAHHDEQTERREQENTTHGSLRWSSPARARTDHRVLARTAGVVAWTSGERPTAAVARHHLTARRPCLRSEARNLARFEPPGYLTRCPSRDTSPIMNTETPTPARPEEAEAITALLAAQLRGARHPPRPGPARPGSGSRAHRGRTDADPRVPRTRPPGGRRLHLVPLAAGGRGLDHVARGALRPARASRTRARSCAPPGSNRRRP